MSNFVLYQILDACRERDCPVCRVEQKHVERYLENQFYESVNSPRWRDRLRGSLGFCHEHAWLAADKRLGDALGFSIIYRDVLNTILRQLEQEKDPGRSSRHWSHLLREVPAQVRTIVERTLAAISAHRRCPVCEHQHETTQEILSALVDGLNRPDVVVALRSSGGLCLPHLKQSLEVVKDLSSCQQLLDIHREKMNSLRGELDEFIRKNDYRDFHEGFGSEGDAWLRAIALVVGRRKR